MKTKKIAKANISIELQKVLYGQNHLDEASRECGCPIGMLVYKGGESFIEMLNFAEQTLKVCYITVGVAYNLFRNQV